MNMPAMSIVIAIVAIVIFTISFWRLRDLNRRKQVIGLQWLKLMRLLLANMQKHRGLSTAAIRGDEMAHGSLKQLQVDLAQDFERVEQVDVWVIGNENWQAIKSHWMRLKDKCLDLEVDNNLTQHGKIISNLLYIIEEMADEHNLLTLDNIERYGYDFVWKDILESVEYMGQLRALGAGVAASGTCNSVERIRVNYLKDKITAVTAKIWNNMPQSGSSQTVVKKFLSCVDLHILGKEVTVSSQHYFNYATQAIDAVYSEYDKILVAIDQR